MNKNLIVALTLIGAKGLDAQTSNLSGQTLTLNPITTAVPFLMISPDSKQGAMGDVGAATDPDVNSIHWNGSKLAFAEKKFGFGFTVTPWLRNLVPDINMYYLAGYGKLNDRQTVGASLRYFSLGNIELTDNQGVRTGSYKPNEWSVDLAFSQKLSKQLALGVAGRFVNSTISRVYVGNGNSGNAASTFAADVSLFYRTNPLSIAGKKATGQLGLAFTNIGAKIRYSNDANFIPMNLRLGGGLKTALDEFNSFGVYLDFNKLLVPTPPIYEYSVTSTGTVPVINPTTGQRQIAAGKDPNVDVATGMLQSFGDAPGGGREELREINTSVGMEYSYNNIFAVRGGYFHESKSKGARQFFTFGIGFRFKVINVDGSYLIPTSLQNPLQRTWRITLTFLLDAAEPDNAEKAQP